MALVYPDQDPLPRAFDRVTNIPKTPTLLPPLGLLYLAANTPQATDVIDNRVERLSDARLAERLAGYDLVGFSGTIFEAEQARRVSAELMRRGQPTVYGGPNATVNGALYRGQFTMVFRGEGEQLFGAAAEALLAGADAPARLAALGFVEDRGNWTNPAFERIADLDALRPPAREKIELARYRREERVFLPGVAPVDTVASSRGCPFDCAFCSSCRIWGRRQTRRSVGSVLAEIRDLQTAYGTRGIYFREDNFTVDRARVLEFSRAARELGFAWLCESRADTLDPELLAAMRAGGCRGIWFGIETTNPATMRAIGKVIDLDRVRTIAAACRQLGIVTGGGFIVGFPDETAADIRRTFQESRTLGLDTVFFNRLWAIPGSALHERFVAERIPAHAAGPILLPGTKHLSPDAVTDLYYRSVYTARTRFLRAFVPQRFVDHLNRNHPALYGVARRLAGGGGPPPRRRAPPGEFA